MLRQLQLRQMRSSALRCEAEVVLELQEVGRLIHDSIVVEIKDRAAETKRILEGQEVDRLIHRAAAVGITEEAEELVAGRSIDHIVGARPRAPSRLPPTPVILEASMVRS